MKYAYLMIVLLIAPSSYGAIVVQGNQTASPHAFKTPVSSKTYDTRTGTFFVGLSNGTDTYTISKAPRPTFVAVPSFSPVLKDTSASINDTIEFLAFSGQSDANLDVLVAVSLASGASPFTATTATALFTDGSSQVTSAAINDAGGTAVTSGIVQITANSTLAFAAVAPNGGSFGGSDTGIAMLGIGATNNSITFLTKDATTGLDGNKAVLLDDTSTLLKGTSGGDNVIFNSTPSAALYWDDPMQRLFIGLSIESGANGTDIAKSVVVGNVTNGALNLHAITPDSAISGGGVDEIIVAQGSSISFQPTLLRVLHASTGPDYLIVNTAENSVTNRIFALPLVNDTNNPTSSLNGTLAKKDSSLNSSFKFVTPATSAGDLVINNGMTNPEGLVGAGNLPISSTTKISDMVVIDDGVYVSINDAPTTTNDTGIWYSQALFGNDGKILRWTPWSKRIMPINSFPGVALPGGATHNGAVMFFNVDAKAGNVWLVEGTTGQTVGISSWNTGQSPNDLVTKAGALLSTGCYAGLDLDQSTRGFLDTTAYRYALFGGTNKVVFAVTSIADDMANPSSPQNPILDYSKAENLFSTLLPDNAGCCQVLEYSRTSTTADNNPALTDYCFFFAGTENGLFVFSTSTGEGFNPITLSTLNIAPFSTGAWYQMANITGSVVDIKTSGAGHTLYVLTSETSSTQPLISTLYSIPFTDNTNTMFAKSNIHIIARSQTGAFANVVQFYGVQIVATDDPYGANPADKEQLVLATNQGLFTSNASQAGSASVATVTNQANAQWEVVGTGKNATATTAFFGIAQADTPIRQTTWPISIDDQFGFKTFNRGGIHQFSGNGDLTGSTALFNTNFIPIAFNANPQTNAFATLYPVVYFYSDGGRRFLIYNTTHIGLQPFAVTPWNVTQPYTLTNPALAQITRFYWINQIGATGILMIGNGQGLVGLS